MCCLLCKYTFIFLRNKLFEIYKNSFQTITCINFVKFTDLGYKKFSVVFTETTILSHELYKVYRFIKKFKRIFPLGSRFSIRTKNIKQAAIFKLKFFVCVSQKKDKGMKEVCQDFTGGTWTLILLFCNGMSQRINSASQRTGLLLFSCLHSFFLPFTPFTPPSCSDRNSQETTYIHTLYSFLINFHSFSFSSL